MTNDGLKQTCQATPAEICQAALEHYERLSKEYNEWLSTIPHALKVYQQVLEAKKPKEKIVIESNLSLHPDLINDAEVFRKGYNRALQDYRLWVAGRLGKINETIFNWQKENRDFVMTNNLWSLSLAQEICNLFGAEVKG